MPVTDNQHPASTARPTITLDAFRAALHAQAVPKEHVAFVCPMCSTVQSAADLIAAGAGSSYDEVEQYLGFSCVGRFTGAQSPSKDRKGPCNWTLGGFFKMHKLEVVTPDGVHHPHFELATPEQAAAHMAELEQKNSEQ